MTMGTEVAAIGHNSAGRTRCIFRAHGERAYTKLKNSFLQDRRISDETRGLVARLLSLPEDWEVTVKSIIASGKAGRDKVYRMLKEAEEFGYVKPEERSRSVNGNFDRQLYLVSDDPEALINLAAQELYEIEQQKEATTDGQSELSCVYAFHRGDIVKVGTSRFPETRLKNVNYAPSAIPDPYRNAKGEAVLVFSHQCDQWSAAYIERMAHAILQRTHVGGEWFLCSPEAAIAAIKSAASLPCPDFPDMAKTVTQQQEPPCTANPDTVNPRTDIPHPVGPCPENPEAYKRNIDNNKNNNNPPIVPPHADFDLQAGDAEKPKKRARDAIPDEYPYDFEAFWKVYPRREGKALAFKRWKKLNIGQKRRAYVALKRQLEFLTAKTRDRNGNLCPHAATWLHQGRFDDDPVHAEPAAPTNRPMSWDDEQAERKRKLMEALGRPKNG